MSVFISLWTVKYSVTPSWLLYDAIEIAACIDSGDDIERLEDVGFDEKPSYFTVYGHFKAGGCEALIDLDNAKSCRSIVESAKQRFKNISEVYDFIPDKFS